MRYLSIQEFLVIHSEIIDASGGLHGLRDIGLLRSIAEKPKTVLFKRESYEGLFTKAAIYLESIANYHVFIDGNKRTALAVAARFLYLNGYELVATNQGAERLALRIVMGKPDIKTIANWLKKYSRKQKIKLK